MSSFKARRSGVIRYRGMLGGGRERDISKFVRVVVVVVHVGVVSIVGGSGREVLKLCGGGGSGGVLVFWMALYGWW